MTEKSSEDSEYEVVLSKDALLVYLDISIRVDIEAVDNVLDLLGRFPHLGHFYDPLYEAAKPSFDLNVIQAGNYSIYYEISAQTRRIDVVFIEHQRKDPINRFTHF